MPSVSPMHPEKDSFWGRWQVRLGAVAALATILGFLFTWSNPAWDFMREVFHNKSPATVLPSLGQSSRTHPPDGAVPSAPSTKPAHQNTDSPEDTFIRKYVGDETQSNRSGAIVVISAADGSDFPALHVAAEKVLSEKGYAVRPLFRSALFRDSAALEELYAGNPALLKRIGAYRDAVLVGKLRSEISHNASLDMFTAHLFADVRVFSTGSAKMEGQVSIAESGAGFSETAATTAAEERLADKLKDQLLQSIPSK